MRSNVMKKLGLALYHILTLRSENMNHYEYTECCDKIYKALLDIAPEYKPKQINTDFMDIILETNRRLDNG